MKKNDKYNLLSFAPFTKGFRAHFLLSIVTLLLSVVASYMTPQVIRITVDSVFSNLPFNVPGFIVSWIDKLGGREFFRQHIIVCAAIAVLFALLSGIFSYISKRSLATACEGTVMRLRNKLFHHIQKLPFTWHNTHQTGDIIQRCTQDTNLIRNFVTDQLMEIIRTIFLIVVSLLLMFAMNLRLALVVCGFLPILFISSLIFYVLTGKKFLIADETEGQLTSLVQENLTGVRVVRAFGRERYEIERFEKQNEEFTNLWIKLGKVMSLNWGSGDILAGLQVLLVTVVGIFFVESGDLTTGEFLAFISYNSMIVWPARGLGRMLAELSRTSISATRLFDILNAEPEKDCPNPQKPPMDRDIVFDHVSFSYNPSGEVLKDVSFSIKAGSTFGILGATGSGKSTLMNLLDRLYDLPEENGKISIGGVDIQQIELEYLRSHIGIVLQEPFLFSKSFKESIADGASTQDLESVRKFARLAIIDEAISGFSEGYDTAIGERGVTISGGQKQRVAIARMLMQDTPIKIFDDSLSAVDMETDAKIRKSIQENVSGTIILIAHRITTLMNADCILVMDKGEVSQIGTHNQLISTDGIYKRIYDAQKAAGQD